MAEQLRAHSDRSVVVGRDVINSIIVTGDHNRVFTGDYERLRDAYIEPWSVFERVNLDRFVGREWLTAGVDAFLHDHDRGYFILEAEAGLGKTTFLAWLVRERGYIHHFTELAPGLDGVGLGLKNLAAQVVLAYHLSVWEAERVIPGAAARPDYLSRLLKLAADQRQDGEKIVLVVDALDEAGTPPGQNVLGLPHVLPEGVFLIVSQRPVPMTLHVDTATTPRRAFPLIGDSDENQADMRRFLERAAMWPGVARALGESGITPEEFTRALLEKCRGVWIYLHYVVHEIERGERSPLGLDALPDGMTQYYARYWKRWRDADEDKWYSTYSPLLSMLTAAQEAVTAEWLAEWANVKLSLPQLRRLLNERWRPFLALMGQGEQARYRLYHATLREFFEGRVERETLKLAAEASLMDELVGATRQAHHRLVERYLTAWGGFENGLPALKETHKRDVDGGYGLRHLAAHLEASGRVEDLHRLLALETDDGRNAWYETRENVGDTEGYLADVQRAWRLAEDDFTNLSSSISIGLQCRYALVTTSFNSLAQSIPPALLIALVENKLWSPAQGVAYARQVPDLEYKAEALTGLASHLSGSLLKEALATAQEIDFMPKRVRAMTGLASHMPDELREHTLHEALAIAQEISSTRELAEALADQAPHLPEEVMEQTLRELLAAIKKTRESTPDERMFEDFARAAALAALAPHLSQSLKKEAVVAAQQIEHEQARADALMKLAPYLQTRLLKEVLAAVQEIEDRRWQLDAVAGLIPYLPPELKDRTLQQALAAARKLPEEDEIPGLANNPREEALGRLLPRLAELGHLEEALVSVREIKQESAQCDALTEMLSQLAEHLSPEEALAVTQEIPGFWRAKPLVTLAPLLSQQLLLEALVLAQDIWADDRRAAALVGLAPHLSESLLLEALAAVKRIEDGRLQAETLVGLVPHLPRKLRQQTLREALDVARRIEDRHEWAKTVCSLAPYLPAKVREQALQETLIAARRIRRADWKASTLAEMAPYLPEALLREALVVVRETTNDNSGARGEALADLAPYLSEQLLRQALLMVPSIGYESWRAKALTGLLPRLVELGYPQEALSAVQKVEDDADRVRILSSLTPHLSGTLREQAMQEGLATAREVEDVGKRVRALSDLVPYLPEPLREQVLLEALETVEGIELEASRAWALMELAPHMSKRLLQEAMTAVWGFRLEQNREMALERLIPRLAELGYSEEAMVAAQEIPSKRAQVITVAKMLQYLPLQLRDQLLQRTLTTARQMADGEVLVELALHLPSGVKEQTLQDALRVVWKIERNKRQVVLTKLAGLVGTFPCSDLSHLWLETQDGSDLLRASARRIRWDFLCDLRVLAPVIAKLGGEEAIAETFRAIQDVGRWWP